MPLTLPPPTLTLTNQHARQFILAHQHLLPPRTLGGKAGLQEFIQHVGAIQFDPLNVVGRNPDLVLQSRIMDYRPEMLEELLYTDRQLLDGWDKMAAIYSLSDWPVFNRHRDYVFQRYIHSDESPLRVAMEVNCLLYTSPSPRD